MRYVCDCGQVYSEVAAVRECQTARHSAAAGCELADAERLMRDNGIDPSALSPEEQADELHRLEVAGLKQTVDKLRDALDRYGKHRGYCAKLSTPPKDPLYPVSNLQTIDLWRARQTCTCGLDAARGP